MASTFSFFTCVPHIPRLLPGVWVFPGTGAVCMLELTRHPCCHFQVPSASLPPGHKTPLRIFPPEQHGGTVLEISCFGAESLASCLKETEMSLNPCSGGRGCGLRGRDRRIKLMSLKTRLKTNKVLNVNQKRRRGGDWYQVWLEFSRGVEEGGEKQCWGNTSTDAHRGTRFGQPERTPGLKDCSVQPV